MLDEGDPSVCLVPSNRGGRWRDSGRLVRGRWRFAMGRGDARHRLVRLHVMEDEIAGNADRDRVTERRHLADGEPRDLAEEPVHGPASPLGLLTGAAFI